MGDGEWIDLVQDMWLAGYREKGNESEGFLVYVKNCRF
jgi:hypothetical protein